MDPGDGDDSRLTRSDGIQLVQSRDAASRFTQALRKESTESVGNISGSHDNVARKALDRRNSQLTDSGIRALDRPDSLTQPPYGHSSSRNDDLDDLRRNRTKSNMAPSKAEYRRASKYSESESDTGTDSDGDVGQGTSRHGVGRELRSATVPRDSVQRPDHSHRPDVHGESATDRDVRSLATGVRRGLLLRKPQPPRHIPDDDDDDDVRGGFQFMRRSGAKKQADTTWAKETSAATKAKEVEDARSKRESDLQRYGHQTSSTTTSTSGHNSSASR
jgi:hypothetical protein